jgi:hypothetical protein
MPRVVRSWRVSAPEPRPPENRTTFGPCLDALEEETGI